LAFTDSNFALFERKSKPVEEKWSSEQQRFLLSR